MNRHPLGADQRPPGQLQDLVNRAMVAATLAIDHAVYITGEDPLAAGMAAAVRIAEEAPPRPDPVLVLSPAAAKEAIARGWVRAEQVAVSEPVTGLGFLDSPRLPLGDPRGATPSK
jgi:hypothetical protein